MTEFSSIITLWRNFKEVVLLARFVYLTICRERVHKAETPELNHDFYVEYQCVQSFGRCFLQEDEQMDPEIIHEAWVKDVSSMISKLKKCYLEYSKVALIEDGVYQLFSPFVNRSQTPDTHLGFKWDLQDIEEPEDLTSLFSLEAFDQLWKMPQLQSLLNHTRVCTESLKMWAPLIMTTHPRYRELLGDPNRLQNFLATEDAETLKIGPHMLIRAITIRPAKLDMAAARGLTLRGASIVNCDERKSPGLTSGHLSVGGRIEPVLLEYKNYRYPEDYGEPIRGNEELLQLAQLLKAASLENSNLRTLQLRGIIDQKRLYRRFAFVFNYPEDIDKTRLEPISLYTIMNDRRLRRKVCLQDRYRISQTLAKTIVKFHADGWVHKNIQSRSVVFFHHLKAGLPSHLCLEKPYLVDLECARPVGAQTTYTFDADLESNIYRHPARQGKPSESFSKVHDYYALGVVLLEIGAWESAMDIFTEQNDGIRPIPTLSPRVIQEKLIIAARERLPMQIGLAYAKAVELCLDDASLLGRPSRDAEAEFIERVVRNLDILRLQPMADM